VRPAAAIEKRITLLVQRRNGQRHEMPGICGATHAFGVISTKASESSKPWRNVPITGENPVAVGTRMSESKPTLMWSWVRLPGGVPHDVGEPGPCDGPHKDGEAYDPQGLDAGCPCRPMVNQESGRPVKVGETPANRNQESKRPMTSVVPHGAKKRGDREMRGNHSG